MESMEGSLYLIVAIVAVLTITFAAILSRTNVVRQTRFLSCTGGPAEYDRGSEFRTLYSWRAAYLAGVQVFISGLAPISIEYVLTNALVNRIYE